MIQLKKIDVKLPSIVGHTLVEVDFYLFDDGHTDIVKLSFYTPDKAMLLFEVFNHLRVIELLNERTLKYINEAIKSNND